MLHRVLVISPGPPVPSSFGGPVGTIQWLRALRQHGVPVTLVTACRPDADVAAVRVALAELCDDAFCFPMRPGLRRALHPRVPYYAATVTPGRDDAHALRAFCAECAADTDVVVLEHSYVHGVWRQLAPALPRRPALVLHSHNREPDYYAMLARDLPWRSPRRYLALAEWARMGSYERRVIAAVDEVACMSDAEAAALAATGKAVWTPLCFHGGLPPLALDADECREHERLRALAAGRRVLLYTGSFLGGHSLGGVRWFLRQVVPRLRARRDDVLVVIAGFHADHWLRGAEADDVLVVPDFASPRPLLQLADACLVLTRGRAGVKLKLLEAVHYRKPVVSTPAGVVGSALGALVPQADDPEAFAALCDRVLDGGVDFAPLWARYDALYAPDEAARRLVARLAARATARRPLA
jgi:glycosyltransferase involved in cell wall biosynthesis